MEEAPQVRGRDGERQVGLSTLEEGPWAKASPHLLLGESLWDSEGRSPSGAATGRPRAARKSARLPT